MKVLLPENHKHKSYVGKNGIEVSSLQCIDFACFAPHNCNYIRTDTKIINNWVCNTRDNHGCPDHPKTVNELKEINNE